jgi:SAM-dependent methyltransferase
VTNIIHRFRTGLLRINSVLSKTYARVLPRYWCPVCGSRVNQFLALPEFYLKNAQKHGWAYEADAAETCNYQHYSCPKCKASDRDRLYALYIKSFLSTCRRDATLRVLDIAPSRPLTEYIKRQIKEMSLSSEYRTADFLMGGVDDQIDIMDMKIYPDERFDFLCCSHVLEHVSDDRRALRELYRVLKKGGHGIIMVPIVLTLKEIDEDPLLNDTSERWRRFGQDDHVRLYSKDGFIIRLREAGFSVKQYGVDHFGKCAFRRCGITPQSVLYIGEKI